MLDRLFLKYLTKKGKIAYFIGQLLMFALWSYYLLGIEGYSMDDARSMFIGGIIAILIVWGGVCLLLWRKTSNDEKSNSSSVE